MIDRYILIRQLFRLDLINNHEQWSPKELKVFAVEPNPYWILGADADFRE